MRSWEGRASAEAPSKSKRYVAPFHIWSKVKSQKTLKAIGFKKKKECTWDCFFPPSGFKSRATGRLQALLPDAGLESCLKKATRAESAIPLNLWMTVMLTDMEVPDRKPPPHCHRLFCLTLLPDCKNKTWLIFFPYLFSSQFIPPLASFLFFSPPFSPFLFLTSCEVKKQTLIRFTQLRPIRLSQHRSDARAQL